ncbi:MAG: ABC transporter permease [Clostridium sp.]
MKILWTITEKNLKLIFKDDFSILKFIMPIAVIVVTLKLFGFNYGTLKVGIIDNDVSNSSNLITNYLDRGFSIETVHLDESTAKSTMLENHIPIAIDIPIGFEDSILAGTPKTINLLAEENNTIGSAIESMLNVKIQDLYTLSLSSDNDYNKYNKLLSKYDEGSIKLTEIYLSDLHDKFDLTQTAIGFIIFYLMIRSSSIAYIILSERWNKTYFRIFTTPVTPFQYIGGNILANFLILSLQFLITLLTLNYLMGIPNGIDFLPLLTLLLGISLVTVAFGTFSIALFFNSRGHGMFCNLVITITTMVSGTFIPLKTFPENLKVIATFTPQYWVMDGMTKLQMGMGIPSIIINILILLLFSLALFSAAAYKLKFKLE